MSLGKLPDHPFVNVFAVASIIAGLAACRPAKYAQQEEPAPSFNAEVAERLTADDLLLKFIDNELAANREMEDQPIVLVGWAYNILDGGSSRVDISLRGMADRSLTVEVPDQDMVASIKEGETLELNCFGASSHYGQVTARDCSITYHGKVRKGDPYWAWPDAIKDPL